LTILYVDLPGHHSLPNMPALKVAAGGHESISVTDELAATKVLETIPNLSAVVVNTANRTIFESTRRLHPDSMTVLVTELPMKDYSESLSGEEDTLLDHVILNRPGSDWTVHEIRTTLQKRLRSDIFGLEKYLASGTTIHKLTIVGSENREIHNTTVLKYALDHKIGQHLAKTISGISEEFIMNAVFDAPVAGGKRSYDTSQRTNAVELTPEEYATLSFGCDGRNFGISISDPFGAMTRSKLAKYAKKILMPRDSSNLIDQKIGGAGLGIFKILYGSHALICNVRPRVQTEFISLIDITDQVRDFSKMARSIHYFEVI